MQAHPGRRKGAWRGVLSGGLGQGGQDCRQGEEGRSRQAGCGPGMPSGLTAATLRGTGTAQRRLWQHLGWRVTARRGPPGKLGHPMPPGRCSGAGALGPRNTGGCLVPGRAGSAEGREHPAPARRLFVFVHEREIFLQDRSEPHSQHPASSIPVPGRGTAPPPAASFPGSYLPGPFNISLALVLKADAHMLNRPGAHGLVPMLLRVKWRGGKSSGIVGQGLLILAQSIGSFWGAHRLVAAGRMGHTPPPQQLAWNQ